MSTQARPKFLTRKEATQYLIDKGLPVNDRSLTNYASNKRSSMKGPSFVKLGNVIRYRESDLDRWARDCLVEVDG